METKDVMPHGESFTFKLALCKEVVGVKEQWSLIEDEETIRKTMMSPEADYLIVEDMEDLIEQVDDANTAPEGFTRIHLARQYSATSRKDVIAPKVYTDTRWEKPGTKSEKHIEVSLDGTLYLRDTAIDNDTLFEVAKEATRVILPARFTPNEDTTTEQAVGVSSAETYREDFVFRTNSTRRYRYNPEPGILVYSPTKAKALRTKRINAAKKDKIQKWYVDTDITNKLYYLQTTVLDSVQANLNFKGFHLYQSDNGYHTDGKDLDKDRFLQKQLIVKNLFVSLRNVVNKSKIRSDKKVLAKLKIVVDILKKAPVDDELVDRHMCEELKNFFKWKSIPFTKVEKETTNTQ